MNLYEKTRNSVMKLNEIYFWTATISNWHHLLKDDNYKQVIVDSMNYLSNANKIKVYGFVLMPNHVHVIWEMLAQNGKESPYESFLKFTAHQFQKMLKSSSQDDYTMFNVDEIMRKQSYWKRYPLAVKILSREMLEQKWDYIHTNPLQEHWQLVDTPEAYYYSSAYDYLNEFTRFEFLYHYFDRV